MLQNVEEVILLCEWIETQEIRSYLEIGIWTGRLLNLLDRLFGFDLVAACDPGWAQDLGLPLHLPPATRLLEASSHSAEFLTWRRALGPIDLVMIDGIHSYEGVRQDFEINRGFPHRYLAFHDIANTHPAVLGVQQLWHELEGEKVELVRPLADSPWDMGIGIWRASPAAPRRQRSGRGASGQAEASSKAGNGSRRAKK